MVAALDVFLHPFRHVLRNDGHVAVAALYEEFSPFRFYMLRHLRRIFLNIVLTLPDKWEAYEIE